MAQIRQATVLLSILLYLFNPSLVKGQTSDTVDIAQRVFMPSIQMGYINNFSSELSGGMVIQTSVEYRIPNGLSFRINFDDLDINFDRPITQNNSGIIGGKVSMNELIAGIGYRKTVDKHHLLLVAQAGMRFYGFPIVNIQGDNIAVDIDNRNLAINRYTLGYEYEIDRRVYLTIEVFGSHPWEKQDYWNEKAWSAGLTLGILATIF